jgi:quercetin dioxygenase-like cupin family protein
MPHSPSSPCHTRYENRRESRTMLTRSRALVLAAMLGVSGVAAPATWAQDATPDASPAAATPAAVQEPVVNTLMSATFEEFPPAPMTVRMLRITLEPGASTPMHTHPGPEFDLIESGELTFRSEGEAPVTRADGTEEVSTGEEITLSAGDWILFPPEVGMYYINNGDEPVVMLSAVMLPVGTAYPRSITYTEGQPTSDQFGGVDFVVLGDGLIQDMPDAPLDIAISETTVPAGADLPASDGIAMYSQVAGNFSFIVDDGMVQVSRSELESLQPNAVAGEEFILEEGDAAFFPAGVAPTPRDGESGELTLLTLEMTFGEEMSQEPAAITFTSGASASGDATGGPETADDAAAETTSGVIGQIGTINSEFVNVRSEPSTTADVVDQFSTGVEVEIVGGPVEAEDLTWYEVQATTEGGSRGWMSADFVDGIEAEPVATEAAAEETPAPAESDATGTVATGDVVQLTEDTVRVRAEGNLGGEIINTFDTGTQFEVTGEPVTADGYTWYPVALVDDPSITGWVPADFFEAAP